jgi:hypothetical protein
MLLDAVGRSSDVSDGASKVSMEDTDAAGSRPDPSSLTGEHLFMIDEEATFAGYFPQSYPDYTGSVPRYFRLALHLVVCLSFV